MLTVFLVHLTELMYTLCDKFRMNPSLQNFFYDDGRRPNGNDVPPQFLVFSSLLPYIDRPGTEGDHARNGVLCCLQTNDPDVCQFIELHSGVRATRFDYRGLRAISPPPPLFHL